MPIYEYECTSCGRIGEALQKFSDKPLKKCRYCSGKLHTQFSSKPTKKEEKKPAESAGKSNEKKIEAKSKAADKTS